LSSEDGLLIIGKSGNIHAEVNVGSAIIEGKVNGNIIAKDKIELRSTAQHFGNIQAARLVVEEGVIFVGKVNVNPQKTKIEPIRPEIEEKEESTETTSSTKTENSEEEDLQEDFLQ